MASEHGGGTRAARMGPGDVLALIREAETITRGQLIVLSGLGRSTISQRIETLLAADLVREIGGASTGGRPASALVFNHDAGVVLAADLGATHSRVALTDLRGEVLAEVRADIAIADGPERVLDWVEARLDELLTRTGRDPGTLRAIGMGVPGPVEFASGRPVSPPIMPGWDGFAIPARLQERHPVPVLVDNDVNIMAFGEFSRAWPKHDDLLYVKVGTGIGCGIVTSRKVYRGALGAAGDIGHIRLAGHDDVLCECGNVGCLEAVAGGRALARALTAAGTPARGSLDVVDAVRAHDVSAIRLVRQAGRDLGEVMASLVNALNPEVIVIGGDVAEAHEQLLAGVREIIYKRSTPLAARHLQLAHGALGDRAGIAGAAMLAIEHALDPVIVDDALLALAS